MAQKNNNSDFLIHFFLLFCIAALVGGFLFLLKEVRKVRNEESKPAKETIVREIQKLLPNPEEGTKSPVESSKPTSTISTKAEKKIAYLNLNGQYTTQSTDWTDVGSTDILINLEEEYGKDAYVDWDAAIKTSSSGSKVYVRLYDATNKIGVAGSDLETSSIASTRVASGRLYLWRGHNTYRVQIKSLNGIDASFDGGRIKIVY